MEDTIVISEEGHLPCCENCGLFTKAVDRERHQNSNECIKLTEKRRKYFKHLAKEAATSASFTVNGTAIRRVYDFKYLGRILDHSDNDNLAAERQPARARQKWGCVGKVLSSEGASPKVTGYFYKAIVQAVLLYGSESWTVLEFMLKKIRSFHACVARYICNRHIRSQEDGTWEYPPTEEVLEQAGLFTIDTYIRRQRETIGVFVRNRPIYTDCIGLQAIDVNRNRIVW